MNETFRVAMQVSTGRNQIARNVGSHNAIYLDATATYNSSLELAAGYTFESPEPTTAIVLRTDGPVTFTGERADGSMLTLQVSQLLMLDEPLKSFSVGNTSTVPVRAWINYVAKAVTQPID